MRGVPLSQKGGYYGLYQFKRKNGKDNKCI